MVEKSTRNSSARERELVDLEAPFKSGGAGREINDNLDVSDGPTRSRCYGDFWGCGGRPTDRGFPAGQRIRASTSRCRSCPLTSETDFERD